LRVERVERVEGVEELRGLRGRDTSSPGLPFIRPGRVLAN
jgi:hypothetical protein